MLDALNITEAEAAGISRIAELDLAMAEHFAAKAMAAHDAGDDEAQALHSRCYNRHSRAYRQAMLLKARLQRELQRIEAEEPVIHPEDRPAVPPLSPAHRARRGDRAVEVIEAARKVVWAEYEALEGLDGETDHVCADWLGGVERWLRQRVRDDAFADAPLDDHVAQVCADLRLDPQIAARWRDLPDPPEAAFEPPPPDPNAPPKPEPAETWAERCARATRENQGFWYKPAGWQKGDRYGYYTPGAPVPDD